MRPPTRVLFVDHESRLSGAELNLVELLEHLDPDRVERHLAVPGVGPLADRARLAGVTVHVVPLAPSLLKLSRWELTRHPVVLMRNARALVSAVREMNRLVRRLRPDIVHTNSQKAHLLLAPVTLRHRITHVWHMQDILERGWLRLAVKLAATVTADRVIALSEATAAPLCSGRLARRVRVVYSGVPQEPADPVAAGAVRDALAPNGPLIGIVGQLARWKGQDVVIDAMPSLLESHPNVHLAIVGANLYPENEREYENGLHARVSSLGLHDRVSFTGAISPVEPVMAALDVAVHASRLPEPFGRVIVEALVQGTPVVSTTIGAAPELVPPDAGRLVPPGDPEALALALGELLEPSVLETGSAAARLAGGRFTPEATRDGVLRIYEELGR